MAAGIRATATITRPNDTSAYTANDVIGAATGSTAALTFSALGPVGGEIEISTSELEIDASAVISGETSYTLHLYSVAPPSALGDNAAFDVPAGDRVSYLGSIALGTPVDLGSTLYVQATGLNKVLAMGHGDLHGYLVTAGGYTPTANRVYKITLNGKVL